MLDELGKTTEAVAMVIPHQANKRIIDAVGRKLGLRTTRSTSTSTNTATPVQRRCRWRSGRLGRWGIEQGLGDPHCVWSRVSLGGRRSPVLNTYQILG